MNRTLVSMSKGVLLSGALMMGVFSSPAQAQVEITFYPPAAFRATAQPVYYEGRAAYWYNGRWYYQSGGSWEYYRVEPRHLRERRVIHVPVRKHYERRHHRGGHRR